MDLRSGNRIQFFFSSSRRHTSCHGDWSSDVCSSDLWLDGTEHLPELNDFQQPAQDLLNAFETWRAETGAPLQPVDVMGFSQGAALAYALAAFFPQQIANVIALAGFLPSTTAYPGPYAALRQKRVFIAHGSRDETVPISNARFAVETLNQV